MDRVVRDRNVGKSQLVHFVQRVRYTAAKSSDRVKGAVNLMKLHRKVMGEQREMVLWFSGDNISSIVQYQL